MFIALRGSASHGLDYLRDNAATLYADAMEARDNPDALLEVFLRVPGLGLAKAGFACQLFAGIVGCLDTHNIKLYGVPMSTLSYNKNAKRDETKARRRQAYLALCERIGGSEKLWRAWCEYKASIAPGNWDNGGESVSALHVECLRREYRHNVPDLFTDTDDRPRFSPDYTGGE